MAIFNCATEEMPQLFHTLFHQGIHTYKQKHSKASLSARMQAAKEEQSTRQGAIFVVRQKEDFTANGVKGYIVTSKETLLEDAQQLTHFTPNVYRTFGYTDDQKRYICGFEERNLQQINTFVVDIDTKKHDVQQLLLTCMDDSIGLPTWIVESERGYQLYFVLQSPLFISNKADYQGLKVAKRISDNLKRSLRAVDADMYCNDFGFFRLPTPANIVYKNVAQTYTMYDFINWSQRQDDGVRPLFVVPTKKTIDTIIHKEWFDALIHTVNIQGTKGVLGRNNTLFTLALIGYAEGWDYERTENFLDEFNTRLTNPLSATEMYSCLQSAYSGKYYGPKKEYVEAILTLHVKHGDTYDVSFGQRAWYKFKKERQQRTRSHYEEWEQDIIHYVTAEKDASEPFIWCTQKELCKAVGIAQSSLNEVLKRSRQLIKTVVGKGRGAKTGWTTIAHFMMYVIKELRREKEQYRLHVAQTITQWTSQLSCIADCTCTAPCNTAQLIHYLQRLLNEQQEVQKQIGTIVNTS